MSSKARSRGSLLHLHPFTFEPCELFIDHRSSWFQAAGFYGFLWNLEESNLQWTESCRNLCLWDSIRTLLTIDFLKSILKSVHKRYKRWICGGSFFLVYWYQNSLNTRTQSDNFWGKRGETKTCFACSSPHQHLQIPGSSVAEHQVALSVTTLKRNSSVWAQGALQVTMGWRWETQETKRWGNQKLLKQKWPKEEENRKTWRFLHWIAQCLPTCRYFWPSINKLNRT